MNKRTKCIISHPFLASVPFPKAQSARYHQYRVQVLEAWTSVAGFPVHKESFSEKHKTVPIVKNISSVTQGKLFERRVNIQSCSFHFIFLSNAVLGLSTTLEGNTFSDHPTNLLLNLLAIFIEECPFEQSISSFSYQASRNQCNRNYSMKNKYRN